MSKLYRDEDNGMIKGIFSGLSDSFEVDPNLLRMLYVGFCSIFPWLSISYLIWFVLIPNKFIESEDELEDKIEEELENELED